MNRRSLFAALLIASLGLILITVPGCSGGSSVAGTYELDKAAVKEAAQAEIDKIEDETERGMAGMMIGMIDTMSMTMTLNEDGTASATTNMMGMGEDTIKGTWKVDGNKIEITMTEDDGTEDTAHGTVSGDTITLTMPGEGDEKMPFDLVFKKKV